jgi:hypothetical protein
MKSVKQEMIDWLLNEVLTDPPKCAPSAPQKTQDPEKPVAPRVGALPDFGKEGALVRIHELMGITPEKKEG